MCKLKRNQVQILNGPATVSSVRTLTMPLAISWEGESLRDTISQETCQNINAVKSLPGKGLHVEA